MACLSRRSWLVSAGSIVAAGKRAFGDTMVPRALDHIIVGCSDLDRVVRVLEDRTGVRAVYGGVHPGRGTRNSLLSLGEQSYLELMAPDPKQERLTAFPALPKLDEPKVIGWVVHTDDIDSVARRLRDSGVAFLGPADGSRKRPDGRELRWRILDLVDDGGGVLPSFIQWDSGSVHPSTDAPHGCHLVQFAVEGNANELQPKFRQLGVEVVVASAQSARLSIRVAGPKGICELSS
jgi:catechol 2,3-dioxygenase-like lactoylglutathione lyase family enzyme